MKKLRRQVLVVAVSAGAGALLAVRGARSASSERLEYRVVLHTPTASFSSHPDMALKQLEEKLNTHARLSGALVQFIRTPEGDLLVFAK